MNQKLINFVTFLLIIASSVVSVGCMETKDTEASDIPTITETPTSTPKPTSSITIKEDTAQSKPLEYDNTLVREYEIVKTEDLSIKALDKALSQYSLTEIENLPTNIRKEYRILIPSDVSKEELKATLIQVVIDKTSENKDIDLVAVFAYDRKEDINGAFTFGLVEWCPNGNWADVTSEIAFTNDRSSYRYVFEIKDKVGNKDELETPTYLEFEIYDDFNTFYDAEWENIDMSDPYAMVDENLIFQKVAKKHGISEEEAEKIIRKVGLHQMK